uniref:DUF4123 domain-containing protein n=1 Tax=Xanthomonas fragariae TaxID=48664 RepID=UPI000D562545
MKHPRLPDADAYQRWVLTHLGEGQQLFALIDPARYADIDDCQKALGIKPHMFAELPNLYEKYALSIRAHGPRLLSAPIASLVWDNVFSQAYLRQSASFLIADRSAILLDHLRTLTRLRQPDGGNLLFRFQDVIVMSALAPVLGPVQQTACVGPAVGWFMVDVCGVPHRLQRMEQRPQWPALALTQAQLARLDDALAPYTIIHQANETDETLLLGLSPCARVGPVSVQA